MLLTLCRDWRQPQGFHHEDIAEEEDGIRYFLEPDGSWQDNGPRAKRWKALLGQFRRSDWGDRVNPPYHISGCPCNQYLAAFCSTDCDVLQDLVYDLGGWPKDFEPDRDGNNRYTSSAESYG